MSDVFTFSVTEARTKLSEIIDRIVSKKEKIMITKKGKKVAMVIPLEEPCTTEEGLIKAKGALSDVDDSIDDMVNLIYEAREKEISREVHL